MRQNIIALALILLVLSTSVFIMIAPTFFTQGISRVELQQDLSLEHILDNNNDIELVFFGYSGCQRICTPRLENLAIWFKTLTQHTQKKVSIKFIDISVPQDPKLPDAFAKAFHESFSGVYLDPDILRVYTKAFNVYFSKSLLDETEMDHTAHLYLTKRDTKGKQLRFIYTAFPYDFLQIQSDIQEIIHE